MKKIRDLFIRMFHAIVESRTRTAEKYITHVLGKDHVEESVKSR